jgi:hypothetical protein
VFENRVQKRKFGSERERERRQKDAENTTQKVAS